MAYTGITTYLWFDGRAQEAADFYTSLFPGSTLGSASYYQADAQQKAGEVLVIEFELLGQRFAILNGGPQFPQTEAVSLQVSCETQEDVDRLWDALIANGGEAGRCGWCKDRFGVSWQVIPQGLGELLSDPDPEVSQYAFTQMMTMGKIDLAQMRRS